MESISLASEIYQSFGLDKTRFITRRFGHGYINRTFLLQSNNNEAYILQRINTQVFTSPEAIASNYRLAANFLKQHYPDYLFVAPLLTVDQQEYCIWNNEYWRLLPYIPHTVALDAATTPEQAYEAARQFGRLTRYLHRAPLHQFKVVIPNFHNLTLRYSQLQEAIRNAREERREYAEELIEGFLDYSFIAIHFEEIKTQKNFPDRLMHHDTKINNVLLDENTYKGVCVIDLDTLMPGKIISDLGDMVRTYVSPASEEERDFSKVEIRDIFYEALIQGYLEELREWLTPAEKASLYYAGLFMTYMQGIRFLTDFLNGDVYYPIQYPEHNFYRAKNQFVLLQQLIQREHDLKKIIQKYLS
ncbi:MAG: aminoglycoside phosphotransferase family protein [Thermoflavifilum sp.]|nr:aminoglycoside phosphotransferase family protein [Thermoflavifilum sp.]